MNEEQLFAESVECEEFYNLMQTYRHAKLVEPDKTVEAYNAVKVYIARLLQKREQETTEQIANAMTARGYGVIADMIRGLFP